MRPSSADHSTAQSAGDVHRDRGASQRASDPKERRQRKALADTGERVRGGQRTPDRADPVGDLEPGHGFPVRNSRLGSPTADYGPPTGHVVAHRIGGPPPRPRDPNRPPGRIGPYGDDVVSRPE